MNLYQFTQTLFLWCENHNIPVALCRPKFTVDEFENTDLDIAVDGKDIEKLIQWLKGQHYQVTCCYERHDGVTYHFYKQLPDNQSFFFHIDFITSFEICGVSYFRLKEIFNRSYVLNGINYLDMVDQSVVLIVMHGLKHRNSKKIQQYYSFLNNSLKEYSFAIQEKLESIFGATQAADIINAIRINQPILPSFSSFFSTAWKTNGVLSFVGVIQYYLNEIMIRFKVPKTNIVFLGVDGAGKTSLINRLQQELHESFPIIKHAHLLPALPWQQEKNAHIVQNNPHNKPKRSYLFSLLKLFYFFARYWFVMLCPSRKPILYLYDRYIYDLAIDPIRFRYNGPKNLQRIFEFFPKPDLCFIVDVSPETAQLRKQEVSFKETKRQVLAYRELKGQIPNSYILKNEFPMEKITTITKDIVIQKLVSNNENQH